MSPNEAMHLVKLILTCSCKSLFSKAINVVSDTYRLRIAYCLADSNGRQMGSCLVLSGLQHSFSKGYVQNYLIHVLSHGSETSAKYRRRSARLAYRVMNIILD
jgi:hypothetical protein